MKKISNKKFSFEKFEMAKLNNPRMIKAGDSSAICTTTDRNDPDTSKDCNDKGNGPVIGNGNGNGNGNQNVILNG